jgi:hypothetical protein
LNPYAGSYYLFAKTSQGHPIEKTIIQSSAWASSSSSSGEAPNQDFAKDYLEIENSACQNPAIEVRRINMVGLARVNSQNSSSKYPTIGGSETYDARTPNSNIV